MSDKLDFNENTQNEGPVECLGMTFENDEVRREYFTERLREKLKDPEFRKIDGFPIGEDEDILALSDPPYYTACPNPFLDEFIEQEGKPYDPDEPYHCEPFAADVSEGKNDPLYRLPSYYTKVPYKAINHYINNYTKPGDIVLDAFCGTGMTGLACKNFSSLDDKGNNIVQQNNRRSILVDLSPSATFIASKINSPIDKFLSEGDSGELGSFIQKEISPLYTTNWEKNKITFDYAIWSDWGECPECGNIFRIYDQIFDYAKKAILSNGHL